MKNDHTVGDVVSSCRHPYTVLLQIRSQKLTQFETHSPDPAYSEEEMTAGWIRGDRWIVTQRGPAIVKRNECRSKS